MYRALGVYLREKGVDIGNILPKDIAGTHISFSTLNHIKINGEDYE